MTSDTSTSSSVKPDICARGFMSVAPIGGVTVAVSADRRPPAWRDDDATRWNLRILAGVRDEADARAGAAGFPARAGEGDVRNRSGGIGGVRARDVEARIRVLGLQYVAGRLDAHQI